jgi:hypothetical protein
MKLLYSKVNLLSVRGRTKWGISGTPSPSEDRAPKREELEVPAKWVDKLGCRCVKKYSKIATVPV